LDVFFGNVRLPAGEARGQSLDVLVKEVMDGDGVVANAEVVCERAASSMEPAEELLAGMPTVVTFSFAQCVDGDGGNKGLNRRLRSELPVPWRTRTCARSPGA